MSAASSLIVAALAIAAMILLRLLVSHSVARQRMKAGHGRCNATGCAAGCAAGFGESTINTQTNTNEQE